MALSEKLIADVRRIVHSGDMDRYVRAALKEFIDLNTIPTADIADTAARERAILDALERHVRGAIGTQCSVERPPISPDIESLKEYTMPFYARRPDGSMPSARDVYGGRCNLLAMMPGRKAQPALAFNAHVDTVAPYAPFAEREGRLWGRGAVDDKGMCVMLLVAAKALSALRDAYGIKPASNVAFQFVIEEEMGGNGSLSLALQRPRDWGCIVVCEATDMEVHPANRGATWYRIALERSADQRANVTLLAARVLLALRKEGKRIRQESDHPLFPERPVQTCNGQFGAWGTHPSRVCPMVGLWVAPKAEGPDEALARTARACRRGVARYCARYGDATQKPDPDDPAKTMVLKHFDIVPAAGGLAVFVYGKAGHMGKIHELDCAATKAAYVALEMAEEFGPDGAAVSLAAAPPPAEQIPPRSADQSPAPLGPDASSLGAVVLEGGQGFVPTHSIDEVQRRVSQAALRAVESYVAGLGLPDGEVRVRTTFERLHNNAFARPVDSAGMRAALAAVKAAGAWKGTPVRGFGVSCDARLFADLCPSSDIITFGPGQLRYAHSDSESITSAEILKGAETLVYMALLYGE
jgi:acetylornithine deacetylase/succinyl-diaminopimelate desuccinylase-like protein